MSPPEFDHVAIAVENLPEAITFYRDVLGLPCIGEERVESEGVDIAFLGDPPGRIELIAPTGTDSPVRRFLDRRGEGIHHICLRVDDVETVGRALVDRGIRPLSEAPRRGSEGSRIWFFHPADTHGVLLELRDGRLSAPRD